MHGGSSPDAIAKAQREAAGAVAASLGVPVHAHPAQVLLEELARTNGRVHWLSDYIAHQNRDDLVWGVAEKVKRGSGEFPGTDVKFAAEPSVWLRLEQAERKHLADLSKSMLALGIQWEAREVVRQEGAVLARVVREMARRLGFADADLRVRAAYLGALRDVVGADFEGARAVEGGRVIEGEAR